MFATARMKRHADVAKTRAKLKQERGGRGHSMLYSMLNEHSHRPLAKCFRVVISTLIIMNVVAFVLQSDEHIDEEYEVFWTLLEAVSSIVFLIEYVLRVYTRPESRKYAGMDPCAARLHWMCTWESIIDLIALMPWYIELFSGILRGGDKFELPNFSWLRVLRLFRILKTNNVMESFDVFARVIYFNSEILLVAMVICAVLILVLATLLYYCRPKDWEATGEDFSSIIGTMYLSVMMLTGQGTPEGVLPWYTKAICALTAVFAVAQFAIPASMLTWGFEQEAERRMKKRKEEREKKLEMMKKGQRNDDLSSESSDGGDDDFAQEWREYEDIVAGSDEEDNAQPSAVAKAAEAGGLTAKEYARVLKIFSHLDVDESGKITTKEITALKGWDAAMLESQLDADGDGFTECEEFVDWLCRMKAREEYDPAVFKMLLSDLEQVHHKRPVARPSSVAPSASLSANLSVPDQIIQFADQFRSLNTEVERLRAELKLKDQEIEALKQAARAQ